MDTTTASFTRTVVFTDLASFAQKTAAMSREDLADLVAQHEAHTRALVGSYGGSLVKNNGDAFLSLFPSATEALRCAAELVCRGLPGTSFKIRASAATGDVIAIEGDYFGDAVNLSARINSKTPAGQVWFANRTRLCMNQSEISWEDVGEFRFKGIPDDIRCFRAVVPGQCILAESLVDAAQNGRLLKVYPHHALPPIAEDAAILLSGFSPDTPALDAVTSRLRESVEPAQIWLQVHRLPPAARRRWGEAGYGLVVGDPSGVDAALDSALPIVWDSHSPLDTAIPALNLEDAWDLVGVGLALLRAPVSRYAISYAYDLLPNGRWGHSDGIDCPRIVVDGQGVRVTSRETPLFIDGERSKPGVPVSLSQAATIETPQGVYRFLPIAEGWVIGLVLGGAARSVELGVGAPLEIGRQPNYPGLVLHSRAGQEQICWAPGRNALRLKQSGYTLDTGFTGRRHVCVEVCGDGTVQVQQIHERLPTGLVRGGDLRRFGHGWKGTVEPGELLIVGTHVLEVRPSDL